MERLSREPAPPGVVTVTKEETGHQTILWEPQCTWTFWKVPRVRQEGSCSWKGVGGQQAEPGEATL